ncbi:MAG TPA: SMC family ATPase [Actinomycetota bacterium]|nr:SMC family ATPase [Actinomycetota bacterium]
MRPLRLELQGFTSFREPTVVDFEGAEYFALIGPTGAGKSTIIDAICFALYGSVPRYGNKGLVAPVVSQGQMEAKVRLDFAIDEDLYTAVRVVRRAASGKGATTKEARLQKGEEVLAGNADELTAAVAGLIGLSFEHFTKCVVLPQGEFARFLHDKPADRQDLLVKLLNLGVYDDMRQAARAREVASKSRIASIEDRLAGDLAFATPEALKEAKARIKSLKALRKKVDAELPRLEAITQQTAAAENEGAAIAAQIRLLGEVRIPDDMGALADEIAAAAKLFAEAEEELKSSRTHSAELAISSSSLPEARPLIKALDGRRREIDLGRSIAAEGVRLSAARTATEEADAALAAAELKVDAANQALEALAHRHLAHQLGGTLVEGQPCPVCLQPVTEVPKHKKPKALAAAEDDVARAAMARAAVVEAAGVARQEQTAIEARFEAMTVDRDKLTLELDAFASAPELQSQLDVIEAAAHALEAARSAERNAAEEVDRARAALDTLKNSETALRGRFEDHRVTLSELGPPQPERANLADDWAHLVTWAAGRMTELEEALARAQSSAAAMRTERDSLIEALGQSCVECDVELVGGNVLEAVIAAHTDATRTADTIMSGIEKAEVARADLARETLDSARSHALAEHLSGKAGRFESWIVNEALHQLVIGATEVLHRLSGDKYSLTIDDSGNFLVIDHDNADETRSARTLSGGETFLASLALALALADHLAELAAEGAAHLDAIFLDEGFGTLDPGSLDTVAAAVETLAAGGRMVGIVTHVADLAERVPLQYRVTKTSSGSRVEKVAL